MLISTTRCNHYAADFSQIFITKNFVQVDYDDYHCDHHVENFKEFCVDVSTYEPVEWVEEEAETCETVFVKVPEDLSLMMMMIGLIKNEKQ